MERIEKKIGALKQPVCQFAGIRPESFDRAVQENIQEWKRLKATYRVYLAYGQV
ncbi:MAG TPA: hypothetical protein VF458_06850 [Ktedonobacteraceae bacterium]